jgi:putative nucleotidyltransferase with HDIG domain
MIPVAVLLQEVVDEQGHTHYYCAFSHDISERKHVEEALEIERQQLLSMFDSIDEPIYVSDPDSFEVLYANQALRNKFGTIDGKKCHSAIQGLDGPCPFCTNGQIFGPNLGREYTWEARNRLNNRWYRCIDKAIRWPTGKMVRYEMAVDITDRRRTDEELRLSLEKLRRTLDGTVQALAATAERRDPYTAGHQVRVTQLACAIAEELGLPQGLIDGLRVSSTLHDMGKIYVPAEILNKPGPISSIEFGMIKSHPKVGFDIIKNVEFPWPVAQIVLQHHERINGLGYPQKLRGHQILLEARILGVADVVEAMASHRPYRPALGVGEALKEITKNKGTLYDPEVVNSCVKLFEENRFEFTPAQL